MTPQTLPDRLLAAKFPQAPAGHRSDQYILMARPGSPTKRRTTSPISSGQNIVVVGDNIEIQTPEGPIYASPGDWIIIRGVAGEFYPASPTSSPQPTKPKPPPWLSAPEGDMARALEWLRGFGWVVPDTVKSAIEEAIVAYDPARAGAYSGVKSGRWRWRKCTKVHSGIHYIACADPNKLPVGTKLLHLPCSRPMGGGRLRGGAEG